MDRHVPKADAEDPSVDEIQKWGNGRGQPGCCGGAEKNVGFSQPIDRYQNFYETASMLPAGVDPLDPSHGVKIKKMKPFQFQSC
jgi:hypothetical protein